MKLKEKARRLGKTEAALRNDINRGKKYGGVKIGNEWHWPDDGVANNGEFPDIDYSERRKKHFDAVQSELDAQKKQIALDQAAGKLVIQSELEEEWLKIVDLIRKDLLELTSKLKNKVGDELTDRSEEVLDELVKDLLNKFSEG